ncbi:hypothetical protein NDU88_006234 [Pleurodeles waltl]|uniref:Uncharacterized protein n=1 Tax=Pleurodeles waltl TaxID=8319 RepID=A0AAV7L6S2_PLEWA|nr:hypothetical protein NDU88_006234 [Pleurodeles waltl]
MDRPPAVLRDSTTPFLLERCIALFCGSSVSARRERIVTAPAVPVAVDPHPLREEPVFLAWQNALPVCPQDTGRHLLVIIHCCDPDQASRVADCAANDTGRFSQARTAPRDRRWPLGKGCSRAMWTWVAACVHFPTEEEGASCRLSPDPRCIESSSATSGGR